MIRHAVTFDFKPEATAEQIEQIGTELRDLAKTLPAIKAYACGPDEGITEGNAGFAVVADFDDEEGFISYRDHPQHKEIIQRLIAPITAQRRAVQFKA